MKQLFLLGIVVGGLFFFSSCSDDNEGAVGASLLGANRMNIISVEDTNISVKTSQENTADLSQISTALLGTINDKDFGKMQSSVAFQVRLQNSVSFNKPEIDSVKLFLAYQNFYGKDSLLQQTAKVFLLNNSLEYAKKYNAKTDIDVLLGDEVGTTQFNKKMVSDTIFLKSKLDNTKDSVINEKKQYELIKHLTIKLDNEKVGNYILNAPKSSFESTDSFLEYFKGLYVKTDDIAEEGAIYGFNVYKSFMMLYYKEHFTLSSGKDTIVNNVVGFPITDNSARFNFPKFMLKDKVLATTDKIYLQGLHGTKAKIEMPNLSQWKDSTRISINKAELIFKVAEDKTEIKNYPLPLRLELKVVDKKGDTKNLNYSSLGGRNSIIGLLNPENNTYTFQMPEYLQSIIEGRNTFSHFEIGVSGVEQRMMIGANGRQELVFYPVNSKNIPARVILYSNGENKPIFNVTYTKF